MFAPPTGAEVCFATMRGGAPDIVSIGAFERTRGRPRLSIDRPSPVAIVGVPVGLAFTVFPHQCRARVDEQLVAKDEKMRIARIAFGDRETVHLTPCLRVIAH